MHKSHCYVVGSVLLQTSATFSVRGPEGLHCNAGHEVSVAIHYIALHSTMKAAIDNVEMSGHDCVPINVHLQKLVWITGCGQYCADPYSTVWSNLLIGKAVTCIHCFDSCLVT